MMSLDHILGSINWTTVLLTLAVCVVFYVYFQWSSSQPGPTGLPYLGYYPFLRSDLHVQLVEMTKKYGEVYLLRCTGQLYVHLGSMRAIKEAHITKSDCFGRRTTNCSLLQEMFGEGLGFSNDEKWRVLRKFFIQELREFGLGKKSQEGLIGNDLQRTVEVFRKSGDRNIDVLEFFTETSTKAILRLLLNNTKTDSDEVKGLIENFKYIAEQMPTVATLPAGPLYKYVLVHIKPKLRKYRKCKLEMESILRNIIQRHEREFCKDNIKDLVDCFINERKTLEEKGDHKSRIYTDSAIISTIGQFFGDGSLSIGLLIALVLKKLSCHPDIQKEIQRELDEVIGTNRFPSWDDKSRTPYTNSVIYEIQRTSDFFPFFPSLECTKETTICGCRVPKGTITLVNFYAALRDPDVYEEPEKFDPTRFLFNEERKTKPELPIIFGVGKRACTGEPLTNMEIFLFVTTVMQNFTLHPAKDDPNLPLGAKNAYAEESILIRATPRTV